MSKQPRYSEWDNSADSEYGDEYHREFDHPEVPYETWHEHDATSAQGNNSHIWSEHHSQYSPQRQDEGRLYDVDTYHYDDLTAPDHFERSAEQDFDTAPIEATKESEYYDTFNSYDSSANHDKFSQITDGNEIQVHHEDFIDTNRNSGGTGYHKKVAIAVAASIVLPLLAVGMIRSSQPELTAYDIVQRDSYQVASEPRAIFNLADLNDKIGCAANDTCKKLTVPVANTTADDIPTSLLEIPAVIKIKPANATAQATTLYNTQERPVIVDTFASQMQVQKQWSIIRDTPDMDGDIITSLAKGIAVEVISRSGNWYEIKAVNASGTRGYMHKSTIGTSAQ